jgi:DMSO/TMAO reductase YedYZ molybdopterin-dependent catalytic subunit
VPWGPATISTAAWTGVSRADVLAEAGPGAGAGAAHVAFTAPDVLPSVDQPYGSTVRCRRPARARCCWPGG